MTAVAFDLRIQAMSPQAARATLRALRGLVGSHTEVADLCGRDLGLGVVRAMLTAAAQDGAGEEPCDTALTEPTAGGWRACQAGRRNAYGWWLPRSLVRGSHQPADSVMTLSSSSDVTCRRLGRSPTLGGAGSPAGAAQEPEPDR